MLRYFSLAQCINQEMLLSGYHALKLFQYPVSYLGLWTADKPFDTGYFCIEPWSALPDAVFVGRGLEDKAGIRRLEPGGVHVLTYTTTCQ